MKHDGRFVRWTAVKCGYLPFGIFLLSGWSGAAAAPVLPPQTSTACVANQPGSHLRVDDLFRCSVGGGALGSFASVTTGPIVSLLAQAFAPGFPTNAIASAANANLHYEFQIIGGNPGDLVPVFISTSLTTTGSDSSHGVGFASIFISSVAAGVQALAVCTVGSGCGSASASFQGTLLTHVTSGSSGNTVSLNIQAAAGSSLKAESATASADPHIFIDPSFPNATQYSVVLSPGVGNGFAAVPEPGPWSLVTLGLLLYGGIRRKLRPHTDAATKPLDLPDTL